MLAEIILLLSRMGYVELKDFIDYAEFHHLASFLAPSPEKYQFRKMIRGRRMGLGKDSKTGLGGPLPFIDGSGEIDGRGLADLELATDTQEQVYRLLVELKPDELYLVLGRPAMARDNRGAMAWALLREKAPVRLESRGNIEVKWIKYKRVEKDEQGDPIVKEVKAPYLYLRFWTTRGDSDKKGSRQKSVYIGGATEGGGRRKGGYPYRDLAELYWQTLEESRRQEGEKRAGTRTENSPLYELERRILDCIDLNQEPPDIDHEKLEALQQEILGDEWD
jgi:hypothetical protein